MSNSKSSSKTTSTTSVEDKSQIPLDPILKWPGGKRWLIKNSPTLMPKDFNRYIEPFIGGAALFLHLQPQNALIGDTNPELITVYKSLQKHYKLVHKHLNNHCSNHSEEYYYETRDLKPRTDATVAARMIYLNQTCWNGLYRVNLAGKFNVPIGSKTPPRLSQTKMQAYSMAFRKATIYTKDFGHLIQKARQGDFVFIDPPYTVRHNHNGFIKYNDKLFTYEDQVRLRDNIITAIERGASVLVCNANHKSIRSLYKGIGKFHTLPRHSVLAGKSDYRGQTTELAIQCGY